MKKNGHYRRINWLEDVKDFSAIIEEAVDSFGDSDLPEFLLNSGLACLIARKSLSSETRYLHFIIYEAGAPVAVVNRAAASAVEGVEAAERVPEAGQEFILSQVFCLLRGNHLVWTTHNSAVRESSLYDVFASLIEHNGLGGDTGNTQFAFQVVLDDAIVSQAFQSGIQEIDLGVGAFKPTLERVIEGGILPADGIVSRLRDIFSSQPTAAQIDAAEHVEAKFVLKPGRDWERPAVVDLLASMSEGIKNDYEEEFVIVTKSGFRLTRDKMSLQRAFEVTGNKRVLSSAQVDFELRSILESLAEDGILDV